MQSFCIDPVTRLKTNDMTTLPELVRNNLKTPYLLTEAQIDFYQKNRFIKLKHVLDQETIEFFNVAISQQVAAMNQVHSKLEERGTYGKAFLQLFNLWRKNDSIKELVFSARLGQIASQLMQVKGVRLYHDQALFKEPGGGITPWHADQYYWPLATDKTITAWIPLQATPAEMGPLEFSAGSHHIIEGRDLEIGDESEAIIHRTLRVTDFEHVIEAFDLGELSFHSGWVFHRAGANITNEMRKVMTIIYMDKDMTLKEPENSQQENDWNTWCPGSQIGATIDTHLNGIIYSKEL